MNILKSGCRAEDSKLRTAERLANLIAMMCILAWRVLWLTMLNRVSGELPAKLVFTDIERDGLLGGLNVEATSQIAKTSGLNVIASGGVAGVEDIYQAREAGLAGVILGKALYEGKIDLEKLLKEIC